MGSILAFFPLNGPFWSLLIEFWVANLAFAALWRHLQTWLLAAVILISAGCLIGAEHFYYTMDVGWGWNTGLVGVPRVLFSFFLGVTLFRLHTRYPPPIRVPSWLCLTVAVGSMLISLQNRLGHVYELSAIMVLFPVLIYFGTEAIESNPRLGRMLGDMSYAAYAVHYPLIFAAKAAIMMAAPWVLLNHEAASLLQVVFVVAIVVLAYAVNIWDTRLRKRLSGRPARRETLAGSCL